MKKCILLRRTLLLGLLLALSWSAFGGGAKEAAEDKYPARPIEIIIPFAAG